MISTAGVYSGLPSSRLEVTAENTTPTREDGSGAGNQLLPANPPNDFQTFNYVKGHENSECYLEGFQKYESFVMRLEGSFEVGQVNTGGKLLKLRGQDVQRP